MLRTLLWHGRSRHLEESSQDSGLSIQVQIVFFRPSMEMHSSSHERSPAIEQSVGPTLLWQRTVDPP